MFPSAYNNGNQIVQAPGLVAIRNEMVHETRIIPVDGRPRAVDVEPHPRGARPVVVAAQPAAHERQRRVAGQGPGEAVDLPGLEDLLLRLSKMADDLPELAEVDLNPVLARPDGVTALDCRVHLVRPHPPRPGHGTGPHAYPRRLR